jgi:tetratricopeptide (TPR) repeat protein
MTSTAILFLAALFLLIVVVVYVRYQKSQERDRIIKDLSRRIDYHSGDTDLILRRGQLYSEIGDFARALADFDRVILLNPQHAQAYYERAIAIAVIEKDENLRIDKVKSDVERALELGLDEDHEHKAKTILDAFST